MVLRLSLFHPKVYLQKENKNLNLKGTVEFWSRQKDDQSVCRHVLNPRDLCSPAGFGAKVFLQSRFAQPADGFYLPDGDEMFSSSEQQEDRQDVTMS